MIFQILTPKLKKKIYVCTLTYRIVVAHQISVALGTFWEINKRSPSNKRSLGKIQQPIIKAAPLIYKITLSQFIVMDSDLS